MKNRFLIIILCYGVAATFFSFFEWPNEGIHFILNLPGNLFAESIYTNSIELIGDSASSQAHFTIPWILRLPQVIVLISIIFWVGLGVIAQLFCNHFMYRNKKVNSKTYSFNKD